MNNINEKLSNKDTLTVPSGQVWPWQKDPEDQTRGIQYHYQPIPVQQGRVPSSRYQKKNMKEKTNRETLTE